MKHTRKILSIVLALSLALSLTPAALASDALGGEVDGQTVALHRGTTLAEGVFWSDTYSDLRHENYIVYSPNSAVTPIITYGASATERVTVSAAAAALEAQGYRVVAGINGDYYGANNGVPMGSIVSEGELRVAAVSNYAVGFREDGSAILGAPELSVTVESEHGSFSVASMNQVRYSYGGVFLYSDEFNARGSTGTNAAGYDVVCSVVDGRMSIGETLTLCVDEILPEATDTVVPEGKYVLTANLLAGESALGALRAFAVGDTLTITVTAADEDWNDVEYAIGALYQLVEDGKVCAGLEAGAAPRTAVGQRRDGSVVFYTIDGRSKGYSIGATLTQVAERLVELGCVTALSLDGGGSTTLSVTLPEDTAATVYNSPSGGAVRAVTNHIFLVASNEASGRFDHVSLRADHSAALAGARVGLTAVAVDTRYIPMSTSLNMRADDGLIEQTGENTYVLTAPEDGGTVRVTASRSGERARTEIRVVESPDRIELWCDGTKGSYLRLAPGQTVSLEARAYEDHLQLAAQNDCFTWTLDGDIGTVDENGGFTAADHVAYGTITIAAGKTALTVPVYVSADPYVLLDDFEDTPEIFAPNTDRGYVRFGSASARWDYSAEVDEEDGLLATAAQSYRIPDGYEQLSLWVYGDGSGAQLSLLTLGSAEDTEATETSAVTIDFTGWQQVSFDVTGGWMVTGFVLRPAEQTSGTLYLDQLTASRALAADDMDAPAITLAFSEDGTALTGKVFDGVDGAKLSTLRVTYDGKSLSYTYDHQTGALHAALPAADASVHRVSVVAGDASGNLSRASLVRLPGSVGAAFPDTDGHSANVAIGYLKSTGVTTGDDKGNFNPESAISRQEFAVLLTRWLGVPTADYAQELPFADAADIGAWALDGVRAMYGLGVTKGSNNLRGELCYNPRATISRQEVLTMLGRLVELGYGVREQSFTDSGEVAAWAKEHIDTLSSIGALVAYEDGSIRPTQDITRAEVAELLFRLS